MILENSREPNPGEERLLFMRATRLSRVPRGAAHRNFRNSIGASAPPSTPAPIESTRSDSPRPGGSHPFQDEASGRPLGETAAQKQLADARIGQDRRRRVGDARAAKLEHNA